MKPLITGPVVTQHQGVVNVNKQPSLAAHPDHGLHTVLPGRKLPCVRHRPRSSVMLPLCPFVLCEII